MKTTAKKTAIALMSVAYALCTAWIAPGQTGLKYPESSDPGGNELSLFAPSSANIRSISQDKPSTAPAGLLEFADTASAEESQARYIESLLETLNEPVGAVGFDNLATGAVEVIIQFDSLPIILQNKYNRAFGTASEENAAADARQALREFKSAAAGVSGRIEFGYEYTQVFSGASAVVDAEDIDELAALSGVYSITPAQVLRVDERKAVSGGFSENLISLGIPEIHEEGITGKGVKIGVLDTGIDWNHPDLEIAFKGGYDYIDGDEFPFEATYEEWKESGRPEIDAGGNTFYTSHGTHVCGIIAGAASSGFAPGIAPDAEIYAQRVLGRYGEGLSSGVIAAIDDALVPGRDNAVMDILNLSLGSDFNTAYSPEITAINNAVIAGLTVCVSAGNNAYPSGASSRQDESVGNPGAAYLAVTAAAARTGGKSQMFFHHARITSESALYASDSGVSIDIRLEGFSLTGNSFSDNAINSENLNFVEDLGYEAHLAFGEISSTQYSETQMLADGQLHGKILALKRGSMAFELMLGEAKRLEAGALLVVNSQETFIENMSIAGERKDGIPVFTASESDGRKLLDASREGSAFIMPGELSVEAQPNIPADFSSIGPVRETVGIKPDIIAPGYQILSAIPAFVANENHNSYDYSGAYARKSGTSMAAPHLAGIAALMKEKYPYATPSEIKARLMNASDPDLIIPDPVLSGGTQASVFETGAGFVDPKRALFDYENIFATVEDGIPGTDIYSPIPNQTLASLSFGEVPSGSGGALSRKLSVTIHNQGEPASATIYSECTTDSRYAQNAAENGVSLQTSVSEISLGGNSSETFEAWMSFPAQAQLGRYEGRLKICVGEDLYALPFAALLIEEGLQFEIVDSGIIKPIITNNRHETGGAGSEHSNSSSFAVAWKGLWPGDEMFLLLLDEAQSPIGVFDAYYTKLGGNLNGDLHQEIFQGLTCMHYPFDDFGRIDYEKYEPIPEGVYSLAVTYGNSSYVVGGFAVSDTKPVLTWESGDVPVMYGEGQESVILRGNIYSEGAQMLKDGGIENWWYKKVIGQEANVLFLGENAYLCDMYSDAREDWLCDENGDFEIELQVSELHKPSDAISARALDYYVDALLRGDIRITTGNNYSDKAILNICEDEAGSDSEGEYSSDSQSEPDISDSSSDADSSASGTGGTEAESETELDSSSISASNSETESYSELDSGTGSSSSSEAGIGSGSDAGTGSASSTEAESEFDSSTGSSSSSEAGISSGSDAGTGSVSSTEAESEFDSSTGSSSSSEAGISSGSDSGTGSASSTEAESESDSSTGSSSSSEAGISSGSEAGTGSASSTEAESELDSSTGSSSGSEAGMSFDSDAGTGSASSTAVESEGEVDSSASSSEAGISSGSDAVASNSSSETDFGLNTAGSSNRPYQNAFSTFEYEQLHKGNEKGFINFVRKNRKLDIDDIRKASPLIAEELHKIGMVSGTGGGGIPHFELDRPLKRIEAVILVLRLAGFEGDAVKYTGKNPFQDVPEWAGRYAAYAYSKGIVVGVDSERTLLASDRNVSFKEFTAMLLRTLGYFESKGHFEYEFALDKAVEVSLYTSFEMEALRDSTAFLRGDSFAAISCALSFFQEEQEFYIYSLVGRVLDKSQADYFLTSILGIFNGMGN
ncbi:MAG: S8 family serine peptidase [Clostridiales bacterium]|nr:S8 family serine peptidase [Clostridiales bacterium]